MRSRQSFRAATIRAYIDKYKVNVIEIVGHTDEAGIAERTSNLDKELIPLLRDRGAADKLAPADNAGLGLARAVAVANVLRKQDGLKGYTILPYSAAQLVAPGDVLSDGSSPGDDKTRRRIEIRLRRADASAQSGRGSSVAVTQAQAAPQAAGPLARSIAGRASIIDADTIEIRGERIRLWGIDAVEGRQTCRLGGQLWRCALDAAFAISAHLEGQSVQCMERGRDQYNRTVAVCTVRGGDLGGWLVSAGFALDYRRYSGGRYAAEQAAARAGKRGLWRGEFEPPWEWRRKQGR